MNKSKRSAEGCEKENIIEDARRQPVRFRFYLENCLLRSNQENSHEGERCVEAASGR